MADEVMRSWGHEVMLDFSPQNLDVKNYVFYINVPNIHIILGERQEMAAILKNRDGDKFW